MRAIYEAFMTRIIFDFRLKRLKDMFSENSFREKINMSEVNSINWARIASQSVYFFWSYIQSAQYDKKVNFIVPTGNFFSKVSKGFSIVNL